MCAASQLSGRGPTDVDVAPYLHINQKSDYDIMMMTKNFMKQLHNKQNLGQKRYGIKCSEF